MSNIRIRPIIPSDDPKIAAIIRSNLEEFHLDIPGTAYFDPELNCLSRYYDAEPDKRAYFIAVDERENVIGGVGIAEFTGFEHCAEIQKLYLINEAKGKGYSKQLMHVAEDFARSAGYRSLYLETHTNLQTAIRLYERLGFERIEKPAMVVHSLMDHFYIKKL